MNRRDAVLHDDGSLSYTVDSGGGECRVTIGPPTVDYEPVFAEQAEWLRERRAKRSTGAMLRAAADPVKRDDTSVAVVEAARELFARWAGPGKDADLTIIVSPINRLFWRRWRIVEGIDVRVGCNRNPPPEGLTLGAHRALLFPVRERPPFSAEWTMVEDLKSVVSTIDRQLRKWTA